MDIAGSRLLHDLFDRGVRVHPDKPFLVFEDAAGGVARFTYGEFAQRLGQVCNGFARLGIRRGDNVVVVMGNRPEFLLTWLAISRLGAVLVPVNTANTAPEIRYIVRFTEARHIVTDAQRLAVVSEVVEPGQTLVCTGEDLPAGVPQRVAWDSVWRDEPAAFTAGRCPNDELVEILFTSGTTSEPKGVEVTHALTVWCAEAWHRNVGLLQDDRFLTALPLFHLNAQGTVLGVLCDGATLVLVEQFSASRFWQQVRQHQATMASMVSAFLRTVLAQPGHPDDRRHQVRLILYALNCTDGEKAAFEQRFGVPLSNAYGLSEAFMGVTRTPLYADERWPSIGLPTLGREVRVVDEQGREVAPGTVGEVIVHGVPGRTLFRGYYKHPDATAACLRDGWLHTGDQGWFDADGYLYFYDRSKDVIKRGGENVSASEVEARILAMPQVLDCAVIGVPDPVKDQAVKAYVVPRPGASLSVEQVIAHCATRLAKFKVPQFVEFCEALPKTSVGKTAKKELRARQQPGGTAVERLR